MGVLKLPRRSPDGKPCSLRLFVGSSQSRDLVHPLRRRAEDAVDLFRGFRFAMVFENRLSPRSQPLRLTRGELESYLGLLMIEYV